MLMVSAITGEADLWMLTEILFATIGAKTAARAMAAETAKATATGKDMARGMEKVINTERTDKKQDRSSERSCFFISGILG